jgi:drug/metabolite transporter (DMT)-like permease
VYSTANKLAVPSLPGYGTQLGYVAVTLAVAWAALAVQVRAQTGHWRPRRTPNRWLALAGGVFIGNAYALVIYAMQYLPAAHAVVFTNAGIVIAGVLAMTVFGERERWRTRLAAMLTVCLGLALLAVAR